MCLSTNKICEIQLAILFHKTSPYLGVSPVLLLDYKTCLWDKYNMETQNVMLGLSASIHATQR